MKNRARFLPAAAALILVVAALWGCADVGTLSAIKTAQVNERRSHVYMVGNVGPSSTSAVPVYWKDSVLNYLSTTGGWANSIAEDSSGNLYIAGSSGSQIGYWTVFPTGSTFTSISVGSYSSVFLTTIAVDTAGNVWIEGAAGASAPFTFLYWENSGSPTPLPGNPYQSWCLHADGAGSVYFLGDTGTSPIVPDYWKDGTAPAPLALSGGNPWGDVYSMAADTAGNICITGHQWNGASPGPCYWHNATSGLSPATPLAIGGYVATGLWETSCPAIDSSGNIAIIEAYALNSSSTPNFVYWSSPSSAPTAIALPTGASVYDMACDAATFDANGSFIFAAEVGTTQPNGVGTTVTDGIPVFWRNGNLINLPMGSGNTWGWVGNIVGP